MKLHVARLGLDTTHFTRAAQIAALRASHAAKDWSLADVFREHSRVRGTGLRTRALAMVQPLVCATCGNAGEWQGKPLTLQLDHVNGKYDDNRLENLRWLCPNCHSQTETFAGRGKMRRVREPARHRYRVRYIGAGALAGAFRPSP
ncbi:MAG TPA: HNH endonuclease [Gemmatimonadaceae bacterium]|nr:HNH endonuclease [Gemmatimonadaceae bacterium]